jgi:hypothetical protein
MPRSTRNQTAAPSKIEDANSASIAISGTPVLTATSAALTTGATVALKSNTFQLSSAGGMYLNSSGYAAAAAGPSYHVSSTGASEVRHIMLHPSMCMNDSGHSSILQHPASSGYSAGDPMGAPDSHRRFHMGIRSESEYQQLYITMSIPESWKANGILANFTSLSNGAQVSVPVCCVSRKIANINEGSSLEDYVSNHLTFNSSSTTSNTFRAFNTAYTGSHLSYLVIFMAVQNPAYVFTGWYIRIVRD